LASANATPLNARMVAALRIVFMSDSYGLPGALPERFSLLPAWA
jgi:hypothetical protein